MRIRSICLAILISLTSIFAAAQTCQVASVSAGKNTDRIRLVRFTDGRGIWILGHNHGLRDIPFELTRILRLSQGQVSNENFNEQLNNLANRATVTAREAVVDLDALRELIALNPAIGFVGFESTQAVLENNLPNYAFLQKQFEKVLHERGITPSPAQSLLPLVSQGPVSYLKINDPSLFEHREVRGFESPEAIKDTELAVAKAAQALADLKETAVGDRKFLGNISGTDMQLWNLFTDFQPGRDEQALRQQMGKAPIPAAYREGTMIWFEARLAEMRGYKAREQAVVENVLATGQSGVIVIGKMHLDSIANIFANACR